MLPLHAPPSVELLSSFGAVPISKFIVSSHLVGSRLAYRHGNWFLVSPAMFRLLHGAQTPWEDYWFTASHIRVQVVSEMDFVDLAKGETT